MSAALRHHKLQLNTSGSNGGSFHTSSNINVPVNSSNGSNRRQRDHNITNTSLFTSGGNDHFNDDKSDSDESDDNDDMTSSHCSLSANDHRINIHNVSSSHMTSELPQYPSGTQVKKYFHGHGWCMGTVLAFNKGRYKIRFERPNATGVTTHTDSYYEANEMPRLIKTASVFPGTKLEIYWPQERRYYTAMIKTEQPRKRENYLVCYDDMEHAKKTSTVDRREWIDLHRHRFRIVITPESEQDLSNNSQCQYNDSSPFCAQNTDSNNQHPREVLILQQSIVSNTDEIDDSGTITMANSPSHFVNEVDAYTSSNSKQINDVSADDSSTSKFMHVVSNVPSNGNPSDKTKVDPLDISHNGSLATEPPQTIISLEPDDTIEKKMATNSNSKTLPSHRGISPGSMASSNRSAFHSAECDLDTPEIRKSIGLHSNNNSNLHAASKIIRRISQDTCPLQNSKSNSDDNHQLPSNDEEAMIEKLETNDTSRTISIGDGSVDNVASEESFSGPVDEEGIVIDPDNDEATKTAILSLIDVGSRVAVYWENDNQFFPGTITDRRFRGKPFLLTYDDDDYEWIDLRKHRFKLLPSLTTKQTEQLIVNAASQSRGTRRSSDLSITGNTSLGNKRQQTDDFDTTTFALNTTSIASDRQQHISSSTSSIEEASVEIQVRKRSSRNVTKPIRFKELCDTSSESGDGLPNASSRAKRRKISHFVEKKSDVEKDEIDNIADVKIGTRVAVWWSGDKQYYNAVVTKQRVHKKKPFFIEYDGTDEVEWIDFTRHKFKILPPSRNTEKKSVPENIHVNSDRGNRCVTSERSPKRYRLGSPDGENTNDVRSKKRDRSSSGKSRQYDATDEDTSSVKNTEGNNVDDEADGSVNGDVCDFITVGSRVSVFWEGDGIYYNGVVTRERENAARKHYLEYDDGECAHWIDFKEHWVRLIPSDDAENTDYAENNEKPAARDSRLAVAKTARKDDTSKRLETRSHLRKTAPEHKITKKKRKSCDSKAAIKKLSKSTHKETAMDVDASNRQRKTDEASKDISIEPTADELYDLPVGTRVEIWWDGDETYYKGTITKQGPNKNKKYLVRYDDDEVHWVYFARNRVRILKPAAAKKTKREKIDSEPKKESKISRNVPQKTDVDNVRSAVEKCTTDVAKSASKKVEKPFSISKHTESKNLKLNTLDQKKGGKQSTKKDSTKKANKKISEKRDSEQDESDGFESDASSTSEDHFAYKDFVYGNVDKLKVGSRISIWWTSEKRYFDGTIKKIISDTGCRRPYFIKYDDGDVEWTDLRRRYFRFLD